MRKWTMTAASLLIGVAFTLAGGCAGSNQTAIKSNTERSVSSSNPPSQIPSDAETVRIGSIDWYVNYEDAMAEAKRSQRPVWLHFGENPG